MSDITGNRATCSADPQGQEVDANAAASEQASVQRHGLKSSVPERCICSWKHHLLLLPSKPRVQKTKLKPHWKNNQWRWCFQNFLWSCRSQTWHEKKQLSFLLLIKIQNDVMATKIMVGKGPQFILHFCFFFHKKVRIVSLKSQLWWKSQSFESKKTNSEEIVWVTKKVRIMSHIKSAFSKDKSRNYENKCKFQILKKEMQEKKREGYEGKNRVASF